MKYKLINLNTNEEVFCDKVTIDGFDYYVSDDKITQIQPCVNLAHGIIVIPTDLDWANSNKNNLKQIIATDNPYSNIPVVIDEIGELADKIIGLRLGSSILKDGFIEGYNKSQETHPFSEEDMIEFAEWKGKEKFEWNIRYSRWTSLLIKYSGCLYTTKELVQLWKEQQPKIVYYED